MAVVSISKIQHRRGQKLQGSGLPQLASGELGWAIDTRELYIGNGAVSEGAPSVGNTKILTEYDNILTLAQIYEYSPGEGSVITGPSGSAPIRRSIQDRLDESVSIRSFGARGDNTDQTQALQRAINELFLRSATSNSPARGTVLKIQAGIYRVSNTIYVPSHATIVGEGIDKTRIIQDGSGPVFKTVNTNVAQTDPGLDPAANQGNLARNVYVYGVSLIQNTSDIGLQLENSVDSVWEKCSIEGSDASTGVDIVSLSSSVQTSNNLFRDCVVKNFENAVMIGEHSNDNKFDNIECSNCDQGVVIGEGLLGSFNLQEQDKPRHNRIENSHFYDIVQHAIFVDVGRNNLSQNNRFERVGIEQNTNSTEQDAVYSVIRFRESSNKSCQDYFARTQALLTGGGPSVRYVPEVEGNTDVLLSYENEIEFTPMTNTRLFRLPYAPKQTTIIDYVLSSTIYNFTRSGKMYITSDATGYSSEIYDDFDYVGDSDLMDDMKFSTRIRGAQDTVDVRLTSTLGSDDVSILKFTIQTKKISN